MAESSTSAKQSEKTSSAPKQDAPVEPKKGSVAHPAPSEYGGLPKGENGGPVTIDNPPKKKDK